MLLKLDPEPTSILDIGPGAGQWFPLVKLWFPAARFDAIEVFAPYVERYGLRRQYDKVIVGDVTDADLHLPHYDLLILGDVVEHMTRAAAIATLDRLRWRWALLSIPLGICPQEPTQENPWEEHVSTWEVADVLSNFPVVGPYLVKPDPDAGAPRGVFLLERTFYGPYR